MSRSLPLPFAALLLFAALVTCAYSKDIFQDLISSELVNKVDQAKLLRENKQPEKSIEILKGVVHQSPEYYRAHFNLGLAYADTRDPNNAIVSYKRALEIKQKYGLTEGSIYNCIGIAYLEIGDYVSSESWLKKGLENLQHLTYPSKQKLYNTIGVLYIYMKRYDEAKKYLKIASDEYGFKLAKDNLAIVDQMIENQKVINDKYKKR